VIDWRDGDGRSDRGIKILSALRWTVAAMVVVAAHGGAVWLALSWKSTQASPGEPPPALMIELAPLAIAPEAPPEDMAPGPRMAQAQPEPTPEIPERLVEDPDEKPEPVLQEVEKPVEDLQQIPKAEAVLTPSLPRPEAVNKPPPSVKQVERKKPIDPKKTRAPQTTAPPISQARRADRAAAPRASASLDPSMSPASWRGALMAHLNRHKRFPPGAAGAGIAQIAFTIDRSGRVLSSRLIRSSGDAALDAEAVSLARRASPVPAPPADVGGGSITLAVPIRFTR
jgi:protein TonB